MIINLFIIMVYSLLIKNLYQGRQCAFCMKVWLRMGRCFIVLYVIFLFVLTAWKKTVHIVIKIFVHIKIYWLSLIKLACFLYSVVTLFSLILVLLALTRFGPGTQSKQVSKMIFVPPFNITKGQSCDYHLVCWCVGLLVKASSGWTFKKIVEQKRWGVHIIFKDPIFFKYFLGYFNHTPQVYLYKDMNVFKHIFTSIAYGEPTRKSDLVEWGHRTFPS